MKRGLRPLMLGLLLLLGFASLTSADTLSGPRRDRGYPDDRGYRDTNYRSGFEGRTFLRIHTGLSMPTGDFSDIANTGWGIGGSIGYGIGRNTILSGGVAFHHFGDEGIEGHTNIVPITASVDYGFNTRGRVRPWISGGLGVYSVSFEDVIPGGGIASDSETDFGFNFGFGVAGPLNPNTAWGAGFKFHHVVGNDFIDSDFLALQGGLSFPL
jgi:opacity protein-like surface antigen